MIIVRDAKLNFLLGRCWRDAGITLQEYTAPFLNQERVFVKQFSAKRNETLLQGQMQGDALAEWFVCAEQVSK
jgi:hypothetical protein